MNTRPNDAATADNQSGHNSHSQEDFRKQLVADDLNDESVANLYQFYWKRIVGFARSRLKPHMRAKFDSHDLAQSAFRTFCRRHGKQPFDLSDRDAVWPLLATILVRKLSNKIDYFGAKKRDWQEETSLEAFAIEPVCAFNETRELMPDEVASIKELVERVLDRQSEVDREIAFCCLQGMSVEEICVAVKCSQSKASRVRSRIKNEIMNWKW